MVKNSDGVKLSYVLKIAIEMINCIKKRPVKCRIFDELDKNIGTEHTTLLFRTATRWLPLDKNSGNNKTKFQHLKIHLDIIL